MWERDKHKTKQGFRGMMMHKTYTKIAFALGALLLTAQVQADQLADIKAAGVVKVATFDANPPFGSVDAKTINWWVTTSISRRRWRNLLASSLSWWPLTRLTVFLCCSLVRPT